MSMYSGDPSEEAVRESSTMPTGDAFLYFSEQFSVKGMKKRLEKAWEDYVHLGKLDRRIVRPEIAAAWERCKKYQVNCLLQRVPELQGTPGSDASITRRVELEASAYPHLKRLGDFLRDSGCVAVLCDSQAELIGIVGDSALRNAMEAKNFREGAVWTEDIAGDNAPGTCLELGHPVQVVSAEHFCYGWHDFVCTAGPIRDPFTHQWLGAIDITGPISDIHRHVFGLLMDAVVQIERGLLELRCREEYWLKQEALNAVTSMCSEAIVVTDTKGTVRAANDYGKEHLNEATVKEGLHRISDLDVTSAGDDLPYAKAFETSITLSGRSLPVLVYPIMRYGKRLGSVVSFSETRKPTRMKVSSLPDRAMRVTRMVGKSPALLEAIFKAEKVAPYDSTVLLEGESGTGKELFARLIHDLSPRSTRPFLAINCAAVPSELLATDLFGYEKGAFTGADRTGRPGKFELAHTGSLVLDEISELPKHLQVYLLRFLQERSFYRVGGTKLRDVDVRIIALSNKPLAEEVKAGRFREDLFYRFRVISISVPPLRERKEDIAVLADHFLAKLASRLGTHRKRLTDEAVERLKWHSWPGNVRELENAMEYAVVMSDSNRVFSSYLPDFLPKNPGPAAPETKLADPDDKKTLLLQSLEMNNWNATKAAEDLGVSRATLYRLLNRHGLTIRKHLSEG